MFFFFMFRDVPECSGMFGMFRNVPCSGFYRRPVPLPFTSFLSFVLQSTLALRTPRYYGQPANADKSQPSGETHKEMTETNSDTFLPLSATVNLFFSLAVADI